MQKVQLNNIITKLTGETVIYSRIDFYKYLCFLGLNSQIVLVPDVVCVAIKSYFLFVI